MVSDRALIIVRKGWNQMGSIEYGFGKGSRGL